jgi:hypothetical protein
MSQFLHTREYLDSGNVAVLDCDTQCNFMLLTDSNFNNYKRGGRSDHWNVVIDLGGGSATIKHSLRFLK